MLRVTGDPPAETGRLERRLPFPAWSFWLVVAVAAPLVAAGLFVLVGTLAPVLIPEDGEDELMVLVLLSAALGALLPRALPHVRAVPLTVRRGWAVVGALVAGISALPWVFGLLFASLVLFCRGECLS